MDVHQNGSNDSLWWEWNAKPHKPGPLTLWFELAAFIIIDVIGFVGNILVIAIISLNARMRLSANLFILSLSVADLLVSILVTPMVIVSRWKRQWEFGQTMCEFQAFINHACLFASVFNLSAIAVNRAVATKMSHRYPVIFSKPLSASYIGVTWFFSFLYALFPIMGWGLYKFDSKRFNCIYSRKAAPSYSIFFSICGVILPLIICFVSYATVWKVFVSSRQNLRRFGATSVVSGTTASEATLTKNLFIVWLAFFFCWLPINLLFLIDPKGDLDIGIYTFAVWLMLCNSCVNPIIYGIRRNFRMEYLLIVERLKCSTGSNRIYPLSTVQFRTTGSAPSQQPTNSSVGVGMPADRREIVPNSL